MPRTYKPTGGKPGARKGNTNAVTHGAYSGVERAEKLRAHSALRGARALQEAMRLESATAAMTEVTQTQAEEARHDEIMREVWRKARSLPTFRGALADMVRNRMATQWISFFPDEVAPDWVYAWLDAMPNIHLGLVMNDDDDVLPGVPDCPWEEEGGDRGNLETTPPPIHPRSLWNELFPNRAWGSVTTFEDSVADRLFELVPQFGSRLHAAAYLRWKMRQFAAHRDKATWKDNDGPVLEGRSVGGGAPYSRNPLPWRIIGTPPAQLTGA